MSSFFNEFRLGVKASIPIMAAVVPFGGMYGATAAERGLSIFDGTLLSALVFAGGSQFTALQFWITPLPFWTIVMVVFAVNFRHVLYSASLSRKLAEFKPWQKFLCFGFMTDVAFALAENRHEETRKQGIGSLTFPFYVGTFALLYPLWVLVTVLGLAFGSLIENPHKYALDFILPIYFLALLLGFRHKANWTWIVLMSSVTSFLALKTLGSPWHITIGALAGIGLGVYLGPSKQDEVAAT